MDNQVNPFADKVIPLLTARDVELRVGSLDKDGAWVTLLAYKDARVDMRILDEVYGPSNWQRTHTIIDGQLFCTVSVWDDVKNQWICKQDVGTESKTEAEKGRASDSFKRACVNLGIGRELYDAPFLYIKLNTDDTKENYGKRSLKTKFRVKSMSYNKELGEFEEFTVVDNNGVVRFKLGKKEAAPATKEVSEKPGQVKKIEEELGCTAEPIKEEYTKCENGKWFVLSKRTNNWCSVWNNAISLEKLLEMRNDPDYAPALKVINMVIAKRQQNG